MNLYTIIPEEEPENPTNWSQKEKYRYRFGGFKYSFRGPEYIRETIPQIKGLWAFPKDDSDERETTNSAT